MVYVTNSHRDQNVTTEVTEWIAKTVGEFPYFNRSVTSPVASLPYSNATNQLTYNPVPTVCKDGQKDTPKFPRLTNNGQHNFLKVP